jgi:hypothetical protein
MGGRAPPCTVKRVDVASRNGEIPHWDHDVSGVVDDHSRFRLPAKFEGRNLPPKIVLLEEKFTRQSLSSHGEQNAENTYTAVPKLPFDDENPECRDSTPTTSSSGPRITFILVFLRGNFFGCADTGEK